MKKFITLFIALSLSWTLMSNTVFATRSAYSGASHSLKTSLIFWKYERLSVTNNENWALKMTATVKIFDSNGSYIDGNSIANYKIPHGQTKKLDSPSSSDATSGKYNYLLTTEVGGSWNANGTDT